MKRPRNWRLANYSYYGARRGAHKQMLDQAKHPKVIIALCVFMVVAIAAVAVFESSGGSFASAPTGSLSPTAQVQADYATHLLNIHAMNFSAIKGDYATDASVQFIDANENTGNYTGLTDIATAFSADMFVNFALPIISHKNSTAIVTGNQAVVTSSFLVQGYDMDGNPLAAFVTTHVVYVNQARSWLISYEVWNFTFSSVPIPSG